MRLRKNTRVIFVLLALLGVACNNLGQDSGKLAKWQTRGYISVGKSGGDFKSIQEAIDFAPNGWTIKIHGGTYHEMLVVYKEGLILEAFDPINEPVIIDGIDQSLDTAPLTWQRLSSNLYVADYSWPYQLVDEYEYSRQDMSETEKQLMSVYGNGLLLRGYRGPYVQESLKGKSLLPFPGARLGLAGPYQSYEEFSELALQQTKGPGSFFYDTTNQKLYLWLNSNTDPAKLCLEIPLQKSLVWLKADRVGLHNLIFKNALCYALVLENAWACTIKGCIFRNCHFAIALKQRSSCNIEGNFFADWGFMQGYSLEDIEGTLYEQSAIFCLDQDAAELQAKNKELDENCELILAENIFCGVPLSFSSSNLPLKFKNNLVLYPPINLFSRQAQDFYKGKAEITGNVLSHLSSLLTFPKVYAEESLIDFSYNCIYLKAELLPQSLTTSLNRLPVLFVNNTLALAGNSLGRLIPYEREAGFDSRYNLFYGSDFNYTIYLDNGMGKPMPLVACPYLSHNIYLTPPAAGHSYQTICINNLIYIYQQRESNGQRPSIFAKETKFEDEGFYLSCFGLNMEKIDPQTSGLECQSFCRQMLKAIKAYFAQHAQSPAFSNACLSNENPAGKGPIFGALID